MALDNDTRGWIMTCVSGVACVLGSSIIGVDLLIQYLPGQKNFRIQDSNAFLSSSLSLSFGVMIFSATYGMLPSAKDALKKSGFSSQAAEYALVGFFLAGVLGIQIVSRVLHHYIPSHVVDCDHTHADQDPSHTDHDHHDHHSHHKRPHHEDHSHNHLHTRNDFVHGNGSLPTESSPLLSGHDIENHDFSHRFTSTPQETAQRADAPLLSVPASSQRPSLQKRLTTQVSSLVVGSKASCDEGGPCYGYSDPCGQECYKILQSKPLNLTRTQSLTARQPGLWRTNTAPFSQNSNHALEGLDEEASLDSPSSSSKRPSESKSQLDLHGLDGSSSAHSGPGSTASMPEGDEGTPLRRQSTASTQLASEPSQPHHHHVPTNAFLSIGLQTSIAIAVHKLPEGFITFATNHANPKLGFAVFVALFIHNITEGFAMALPLYLALGYRWKAITWSFLLGGLSQPLGAGVAAIWFKVAGRTDMAPGEGVYGGMFAVTAGIMTSVALQLFSEGLSLTHNRNLCMAFAFIGMGILGISFALTAD
ncbi:MAG: hypothetical protein M1819_006852 [Sarea resinae]|nr:MAG: hypothetical protein M1819_006852 [Sarea resinae]